MKINRLLIVTLILLTVSLSLGSIYAASDFKVEGNVLKYDNIEFNLPEGYSLSGSDTSQADADFPIVNCTLTNGDKKVFIEIVLAEVTSHQSYDKDGNLLTPETKTINGVSGEVLTGTNLQNEKYVEFTYKGDGSQIKITAPDEETISQIVKQ